MAPRLIRLPDTPNRRMRLMAKSMASGMTDATTSPARQLPRKSTSTNTTMSAPSSRFFWTVWMARPTNSERSRYTSTVTPLGNVWRMVAMRCLTALITSLALAPLSMSTMPPVTSPSWLRVMAP
jgi:hypothetical protein